MQSDATSSSNEAIPTHTEAPRSQEGFNRLGYRPAFDGVRGLAVAAVVLYHGWKMGSWRAVPGGYVGVDVFFALSGFLITCLLLEEWRATGRVNFKAFYVRRALRLLPALVVVLAANFLLYCALDPSRWKLGLKQTFVVLLYLGNWVRALGGRDFMGWLGHTWSLAVEEQFYLTWPWLFILIVGISGARSKDGLRKAALQIGALIGLVWLYRAGLTHISHDYERLANGADTRADALLIGCLGAFVFHGGLWSANARKHANLLALVSGLFLLAYCARGFAATDLRVYVWGLPLVTLASGLLVFSLMHLEQHHTLLRFLSTPALVWLGRVSYGVYLWHMVLFSASAQRFPHAPLAIRISLCIALTLLIAGISMVWVEKPFLRLKKKFQPTPIQSASLL